MIEMDVPFGMNFNISVVANNENDIEMGLHYTDSNDADVDAWAAGDSLDNVIAALFTDFITEYTEAMTKAEPEPVSELDKLKAEIEKLKEENARLEHRLQEQLPKEEPKDNKASEKEINEALNYVNDLLELFDLLYK